MDYNLQLDIDKLVFVLQQCINKISKVDVSARPVVVRDGTEVKQADLSLLEHKQFQELFNVFIKSTRKHMENTCRYARSDSTKPREDQDWDDSKNRKPEIQELKHKIEVIKEKFRKEEESKTKLISEYKKAIELIEIKKKEELHNIAKSADELMIQEWQAIEYELNNLQSEEKMVQRKHEYLCKENLMGEKYLRDEKAKCENKLTQFIALYDKDIGKKHAEYENIMDQKLLEKQQLESLTKLFEDQKPPYQIMTEEKAVWKEKELAQKLLKLRTMLAYNSISKFLNNYVKTLRENNIPIVITKKSKGKKKKQ